MRTILIPALLMAALAGCERKAQDNFGGSDPDSTSMTASSIEIVLARHTPKLMSIPGVVGTAQGEDEGKPCILVFVKEKDERIRREIPSTLEGYPVRIDEVGEIRPIR